MARAARKAKSHVRSALAFSIRWNGTPSRGHAFWWARPLTADTSRDHSGGNGKHPHAETSRDHSGGNGKQPVIAHLSSTSLATATAQAVSDTPKYLAATCLSVMAVTKCSIQAQKKRPLGASGAARTTFARFVQPCRRWPRNRREWCKRRRLKGSRGVPLRR